MGLFGRKKTNSTPTSESVGEITLNGENYIIKQVVDCLGDSCPRPQLMTKKALNNSTSGEVIEVRIDNPTSMESIPPMMAELDSTHLDTHKEDRYWRVFVTKN